MNIFVNDKESDFPDTLTATQLVEALALTGRRVAMEVNGEIVPRSRYDEHMLQANDRVEIVNAIGGG